MSEKTMLRFGPIATLDIGEVDAIVRMALEAGIDFDIEFEDSDDDLESYLETREMVLEEIERARRYEDYAIGAVAMCNPW